MLKKPILLKGVSLEKHNSKIQEILKTHGINEKIKFEPKVLQGFIDKEKTFGKGLVAYLKELEKQLDKIIDDKDLKLYIFQILSELGSLVFPNTSACYSIIPNDLKKINWDKVVTNFTKQINLKKNKQNIKVNKLLLEFFSHEDCVKIIMCMISLTLCSMLIVSLNKNTNALLVDENGAFVTNEINSRPRVKSGDWLNTIISTIQTHLIGLNGFTKGSAGQLNKKEFELLAEYVTQLAQAITEKLLQQKLLVCYKTIQEELQSNKEFKTPNYFVWCGSNLLTFPKTLALPMCTEPDNWILNSSKGADNGGYLLSSLTNISYQGNLSSKSHIMHAHKLYLKDLNVVNSLQKVKHVINSSMVEFYLKHKEILTDNDIILLSDTWVKPSQTTILAVNKKWASVFDNIENIRNNAEKELTSKKNETLRNNEILVIAQLYCNKECYWPAVYDFRGRIYRIGHLNIQQNAFVRSLIAFSSDKPPVNRKKNKYTMAKFNLLLKEVLVEKELIEKWDAVFGDRFTNNETFEKLLLDDLLAKKLSLIQIGQLLLIRQGAYDKVGVYYDASASAYQIMGVINGDEQLCKLTNVLKSEESEKKDIYSFFLNRIISNENNLIIQAKDRELVGMYNEYLKKHCDRKLLKAIVMPLIYGKTTHSFAEDLKEFFAQGNYYPNRSVLIKLAGKIITFLNTDPIFQKVIQFMKMLRGIGHLLFEKNKCIIRSDYFDSYIVYYKEEKNRIRLYYKANGKRYKTQDIMLARPAKDTEGNLIRSKTKLINAFIANYIHFLDSIICHYTVTYLEKESKLELNTIHDCFFIKPNKISDLKVGYKKGLMYARQLHIYNICFWLHDIIDSQTDKDLKAILEEYLNKKSVNNIHYNREILKNILKYLEKKSFNSCKKQAQHWHVIKTYLETVLEDSAKLRQMLESNPGQLLFVDNE